MKNKIVIILITGLFMPFFASAQVNSTPYDKYGISSAELNYSTGKFIDGKSPDIKLPYASLTKLVTAMVLLDIPINLDKKVVITKAEMEYVKPYIEEGDITSTVNIRSGDKVTMRDLWYAMLICSSNEAAIALVHNSGLTTTQFVSRMNRKAKALGATKSVFHEPTGIDPQNIGTAREMAVIAHKAFSYYSINIASSKSSYAFKEIKTGRKIGCYSRNNSLLNMKPVGMKVGYLTESKLNVALRLRKGKKDRIIVVLHATGSAARNVEINRLMAK